LNGNDRTQRHAHPEDDLHGDEEDRRKVEVEPPRAQRRGIARNARRHHLRRHRAVRAHRLEVATFERKKLCEPDVRRQVRREDEPPAARQRLQHGDPAQIRLLPGLARRRGQRVVLRGAAVGRRRGSAVRSRRRGGARRGAELEGGTRLGRRRSKLY